MWLPLRFLPTHGHGNWAAALTLPVPRQAQDDNPFFDL
jgi:hypothetical protein